MLGFVFLGLIILSVAECGLASDSERPWTPYHNPILPGFNPDPSCIRVNSDFFCATSTFNYFPGIPIYTSRDLVHWTHLGHVISRPEQLPEIATLNGSSSGIWAPGALQVHALTQCIDCDVGLRFHNGTFYLSTTIVHDNLAADDLTKFDNVWLPQYDF